MIFAQFFIKQLQTKSPTNIYPMYLIYGEDLLYKRDSKDALWKFLQQQGYEQYDRYQVDAKFEWKTLQMESQAGTLFSSKRVIELEIPKGTPGKKGTDFLLNWSKQSLENFPDIVLIISCDKLDYRQIKAKWVDIIEKSGEVVQAKILEANALPKWCQERALKYQLQLTQEASFELARRIEGNSLAADQALQKLSLYYGNESKITQNEIEQGVSDQAHYQLFDLSSEILKGNVKQAIQILQRLQQEGLESTIILWLLAKEIRTLIILSQKSQEGNLVRVFKQLRIWQSKQQEYNLALQRHNYEYWIVLLNLALQIDLQIKGIKSGNVDFHLKTLVLNMVS